MLKIFTVDMDLLTKNWGGGGALNSFSTSLCGHNCIHSKEVRYWLLSVSYHHYSSLFCLSVILSETLTLLTTLEH